MENLNMTNVLQEQFNFDIAEKRYKSVPWTKNEAILRKSRSTRHDKYDKYSRYFKEAFLMKLKNSILGCYIDIFNLRQNKDNCTNENKLAITQWELKSYKCEDFVRFEKNNGFINNGFDYLERLIAEGKPVNLECLVETIKFLRLDTIYIKQIDESLRSFTNLQILSLPGNNLRGLNGSVLPRKLKFLELTDNFIHNLAELTQNPPKSILHIGLGRNCLTDDSYLHLLAESGNFEQLQSLDISDNEIFNLEFVGNSISKLRNLRSLQMEGNPCYVHQNYMECVLAALPQLQYLDTTEILPSDRSIQTMTSHGTPQLIFHCYRILALRQPPKDKKYKQTIHVEFDLPLLQPDDTYEKPNEQNLTHLHSSNSDENVESATFKNKTDLNPTEKQKSVKSVISVKSKSKSGLSLSKNNRNNGNVNRTKSLTNKNKKKSSPYNEPNEVYNKFCFKTERQYWSDIIEFEPVIVSCPRKNSAEIRDTFRTCVTVRIVYLKTQQVQPRKSGRKQREPSITKIRNLQTEKIIKRVTLSSFKCNLDYPSWGDEAVDFYWADHPDVGRYAVRVDGCLKDLQHETNLKSKEKPPLTKGTSDSKKFYPKWLTCHLGTGIKRAHHHNDWQFLKN